MIDIDLRSKLKADPNILAVMPQAAQAGRIQQNTIAETAPATRIWYQRRGYTQDLSVCGSNLLCETTFDLECISDDIETAEALASAVKTCLHGYRGLMGSTRVLSIEVEDHSDDYVPKGQYEDDGLHTCALIIRILS